MVFISGSITNSDPGAALYALMEPQLIATGWTLEDTVTRSGTTWKVLKSAAAGNSENKDWYLTVRFNPTGVSTGFQIAPIEGFNTATDQVIRGCFAAGGVPTIDATTYSPYGNTTWPFSEIAGGGNGIFSCDVGYTAMTMGLVTTPFLYRISMTRDRVIMALGSDPNSIVYAGFFVPTSDHRAHATSALYPLIHAKLQATTQSSAASVPTSTLAAVTRLPRLSAWRAGGSWAGSVVVNWDISARNFTSGLVPTYDSPYTNKKVAVPLPVEFVVDATDTRHFVGTLEDVVYANTSGVSFADTATIGSDLWYATATGSGGRSLFMRGI